MDVFAVQVGGVFGALAGATIGLIVGALAACSRRCCCSGGGDPITILITILGQILVGVIVGGLYTVYAVNCEGMRLRTKGIRRPSRREAALLQPLVESCAASLHMAQTPTLLISDDRSPNASAWTRHIVINVGLMEQFHYEPEPVSAVICHELVHWNSGDAIAQTFLHGVALPLYISYSVLTAIPRVVKHSFVRVLVWLCAWPIMIASRYRHHSAPSSRRPSQRIPRGPRRSVGRAERRAATGAGARSNSLSMATEMVGTRPSAPPTRRPSCGWNGWSCPATCMSCRTRTLADRPAHLGVQSGSTVDRDW